MKTAVLAVIRFYQAIPRVHACRFSPSCSEYAHQAIAKYGIFKGSLLGIKRIFKCHPLSRGGVDHVV